MTILIDALFITSDSAITGSYTRINEEKVFQNRLLTQNEARKIGDINFSRAAAKAKIYPTARLIMNEIRALIGYNGTFFKKINTLARDINVDRRTIQRWLRYLEDRNFIKRVHRSGTTNLIYLKLFRELEEYIPSQETSTEHLTDSKTDEKEFTAQFDRTELTRKEIANYITAKTARDGKTPGFAKFLWKSFEQDTLKIDDYDEILRWAQKNSPERKEESQHLVQKELIGKDENKRKRDLKVDAITTKAKSDERGLDRIRSIANNRAKKGKQKGPLGLGAPCLELTIINRLINKRRAEESKQQPFNNLKMTT